MRFRRLALAAACTSMLLQLPLNSAAAEPWMQYLTAAEGGFSEDRLQAACREANRQGSGAVIVVHGGHVVAAWGDVQRPFRTHSVRKSLLSALYGIAVGRGQIDLGATLADYGIEETDRLTPGERQARVRDLITSRSGVYLPAAYAPEDQDDRPARGSHPPGSHWFYNNWGFNVAGVIFERATGDDVYAAFDAEIARPLGMEDYEAREQFRLFQPSLSRHPAHTFRMSTRDLARLGQLYLQQGRWNGRRILSRRWVRESTTVQADFGNGTGYGYMWWVYERGSMGGQYPPFGEYSIILASGVGGQAIYVLPEAELVIVHRGDTDNGRGVDDGTVWQLAASIVAARVSAPARAPRLTPLRVMPFEGQPPAPELPALREVAPGELERYYGRYELRPGVAARLYAFEGRSFLELPGRGDAELFELAPGQYTVRVTPGVRVRFEDGAARAPHRMLIEIGDERIAGRRVPPGS